MSLFLPAFSLSLSLSTLQYLHTNSQKLTLISCASFSSFLSISIFWMDVQGHVRGGGEGDGCLILPLLVLFYYILCRSKQSNNIRSGDWAALLVFSEAAVCEKCVKSDLRGRERRRKKDTKELQGSCENKRKRVRLLSFFPVRFGGSGKNTFTILCHHRNNSNWKKKLSLKVFFSPFQKPKTTSNIQSKLSCLTVQKWKRGDPNSCVTDVSFVPLNSA